MPARGGSALVVNHRVALSGTGARSAVASHRVGYIATRPGCDRAATEADLARAREREGGGRLRRVPARVDGALRRGRRGCRSPRRAGGSQAAAGAVVCSVIAVRREDLRPARARRQGGLAGLRPGQPHEGVRPDDGHPRVEGRVGRQLPPEQRGEQAPARSRLRQGRRVRPAPREGGHGASAEGPSRRRRSPPSSSAWASSARPRGRGAVELVRSAGAAALGEGVALPEGGRISYGHLRRYHPEAARQVEGAVARAAGHSPELRRALADHERACREIADLRGPRGRGARGLPRTRGGGPPLPRVQRGAARRRARPHRATRAVRGAETGGVLRPGDRQEAGEERERELSACNNRGAEGPPSRRPCGTAAPSRRAPSRAARTLAAVGRGSSELLASRPRPGVGGGGGRRQGAQRRGRAGRAASPVAARRLGALPRPQRPRLGREGRRRVARPVATIAGIPT